MRFFYPLRAAVLTGGLLIAVLSLVTGCDSSGVGESIYDPDADSRPDPVIENVEPGASALAGIDVITITGANFSPVASENLVFFDEIQGEVLEASPTELRVQTPNTPKSDITLRVTVLGAENFSNSVVYRLDAAAERFAELSQVEVPFAVAVSDEGEVLVSLFAEGIDVGIQRVGEDGELSQYAPPALAAWQDLAFGPDGNLYGVFGLGAIAQIPEGAAPNFVGVLNDTEEPLTTLTFDEQGGAWLGSTDGNLFRFDLATSAIEQYVLDADIEETRVLDLAVNGGFLYVALTQQAEGSARIGKVVRFPISGTDLGPREDFVLVSEQFSVNPLAMAFAADGSMLVGTSNNADNDVALLLVAPDGTAEPFYSGIVRGPVQDLAWGPETSVYALGYVLGLDATQERLNLLQPIPDLIRIEARREGA